jgi:hypothetical protein
MFCFGINRDFDKTLRLTFLNGPAHPAHRKFRREGSAPRLPYFVRPSCRIGRAADL